MKDEYKPQKKCNKEQKCSCHYCGTGHNAIFNEKTGHNGGCRLHKMKESDFAYPSECHYCLRGQQTNHQTKTVVNKNSDNRINEVSTDYYVERDCSCKHQSPIRPEEYIRTIIVSAIIAITKEMAAPITLFKIFVKTRDVVAKFIISQKHM